MRHFQLVHHLDIEVGLFSLQFDQQNERVNKLSKEVMEELQSVLKTIHTNSEVQCLVILSKKPGIFVAGADLDMISKVHDANEAEQLAIEGQKILSELEKFPFPTIAAIQGACMGGGTELALCCKYIVMADDAATKAALPEVNLGLLPGAGGTVRLPERIGLKNALEHILSGKSLHAAKGLKLGFCDAMLPSVGFQQKALEFAQTIMRDQSSPAQKRKNRNFIEWFLNETFLGKYILFSQSQKMVLKKTHGNYPAPLKIIDLFKEHEKHPRETNFLNEAKAFGELVEGKISHYLIELFFAMEKVKKKTGLSQPVSFTKLQNVALLGAGVMGGGIAQLLASKHLPVRMKDIQLKSLSQAIATAAKLFDALVKKKRLTKREAEMQLLKISPTLDYSGFRLADLVLEAVVENLEVKKKVLSEVEPFLNPGAVFASNTSSLSITSIAEASSHPERVVGMHFFNPVHKMPLIEIIRGEKTSDEAVAKVFELAKRIGKTPIVVKDAPGFLVNRLLMPYLNEAAHLIEEGFPVEELDQLTVQFGMPMGPATLIDEVGIDVGYKVAHILFEAFGKRFEPSDLQGKLLKANLLGKKALKGFYLYDSSAKIQSLNPEVRVIVGEKSAVETPDRNARALERMFYSMINEAIRCLDEKVVASAEDLDLAMIMGTGFPPFRGGLLKYAESVGLGNIYNALKKFEENLGPRFTPAPGLATRAQAHQSLYALDV